MKWMSGIQMSLNSTMSVSRNKSNKESDEYEQYTECETKSKRAQTVVQK